MADQKRWFKVWNSILTDPSFLDLPLEQIGRWTLLGALISLHGENGQIKLTESSLKNILRINNGTITETSLSSLPNLMMMRDDDDNGKFSVIMKNWGKYQLDSTGYERLKKFRKAHDDNGAREEKTKIKRREDKDKEKNINIPSDFVSFWDAYPSKIGKKGALRAWMKAKDRPPIGVILDIIAKQKESEKWVNGYIPNPETWINQGRWMDQVEKKDWVKEVNRLCEQR
jgi:hypothetical protein